MELLFREGLLIQKEIKRRKTNKYINALNAIPWDEDFSFNYLPNLMYNSFCPDLMDALNNFKMNWYLTLLSTATFAVPLISASE